MWERLSFAVLLAVLGGSSAARADEDSCRGTFWLYDSARSLFSWFRRPAAPPVEIELARALRPAPPRAVPKAASEPEPAPFSRVLPEPHPIERENTTGWFVSGYLVEELGGFTNLQGVGRYPHLRPAYDALGIRPRGDAGCDVSAPARLNEGLARIGSPFRVAAVDGEIELRPWLELVASGKVPVGTPHDLETHAVAALLMPPELGRAWQAQVRFLLLLEDDPSLSPAVRRHVSKELEALALAFEVNTVTVGRTIYEALQAHPNGPLDYARIAAAYGSFTNGYRIGAPEFLDRLGLFADYEYERLGFSSAPALREFVRQTRRRLGRLQEEDPSYALRLERADVVPIVERHFRALAALR